MRSPLPLIALALFVPSLALAQGPQPREEEPPPAPAPSPTPAPSPPPAPAPAPATPPPPPNVTPTSGSPVAPGPPPMDAASTTAAGRTALGAPIFPEDRTPPFDPKEPDALRFGAHGYFRAPFRVSWKRRQTDNPDQSKYNLRNPWLVDDDYYRSGFAYTPLNETDYAELFLMAGNEHLTGTIAFMGSLYSDAATTQLNSQMGISQGYVTYRYEPDVGPQAKVHVRVKGGAFWDRFGYLEKYDTYLFGRTHQIGEQVRVDGEMDKFGFSILHGIGEHKEDIASNQGLSLLNYLRAAVSYDKRAELGLYYLRTWTQDERQLQQITDASMKIFGADVRLNGGPAGRLYAATSILNAYSASYLSPSIEVMHSFGGRGVTENYLGTEKSANGTGDLWNVGWQYDFSLGSLLRATDGTSPFGRGDLGLSLFGVYTFVQSKQADPNPFVNKDDKKMFKYGAEVSWWALHWLGASLRYDRVALDLNDDPNGFRVFSPRISLRTHWIGDAQVFLQYSRYFYGDRVRLRPGQVPLETLPDDNVVKLQGQMVF